MIGEPLSRADIELHSGLGIPRELFEAAGVRRVTHDQARDDCGIRYRSDHLEGIWYPNLDPERSDVRGGRVRRDHPELDRDGKPIAKYVAPPNRHYLFFRPDASSLLSDTSVAVVLVEAEKSVLAIMAAAERAGRRVLVIGTGGCWGWLGVVGKTTDAQGARVDEKGPLPDLARVTWTGRDVVILFDSNVATNEKVRAAQRAFTKELTSRGARVRIGELPIEDGINGPDDYIGKHADAALFALIDCARPMQPASAADVLRLAGLDDIHGVTLAELEGRLRLLKAGLQGADAIRGAR